MNIIKELQEELKSEFQVTKSLLTSILMEKTIGNPTINR